MVVMSMMYQLGYKYKATENSTFNIDLGGSKVDTIHTNQSICSVPFVPISDCSGFYQLIFPLVVLNLDDTSESNSGSTYSISYDYKHEISDYIIALNQSVETSSNGFAQEVEDFMVRYNRKISEKFSAALILNVTRSKSFDSVSYFEDRDIIRIEPSISWRFSKDSRLSAGYRYRQQTYSALNEDAGSNSIYVNLSFFGRKLMSSY